MRPYGSKRQTEKNSICLFGAWSGTSEDLELRTLGPRAESATPSETGSLPVIDSCVIRRRGQKYASCASWPSATATTATQQQSRGHQRKWKLSDVAFTDTREIPQPDFSLCLVFLVTPGQKWEIVSDAAQRDEGGDAAQDGQASWVQGRRGCVGGRRAGGWGRHEATVTFVTAFT